MIGKSITGLLCACAALCVALSPAINATETPGIYDDGAIHVIDTIASDVVIRNNSRVSVVSGGEVRSSGASPAVDVQDGRLIVTGTGRVVGGSATSIKGRYSKVSLARDAHVTGDIDIFGTDLSIQGNAILDGNILGMRRLDIGGNAAVNGNISLKDQINVFLNMSGGIVRGQVEFGNIIKSAGRISGGKILGGILGIGSPLNLKITGGEIHGGLVNRGDIINLVISGGAVFGGIDQLMRPGWNTYRIVGGSIDAYEGGYVIRADSVVGSTWFNDIHISGGKLGYDNPGRGISLGGNSNLSIYGWDLVHSDGRVTGYLSDGSRIDVALTFGDNWIGSLNLIRQDFAVQ